MITKNHLQENLGDTIMIIDYTKKTTGESAKMYATLMPEVLPATNGKGSTNRPDDIAIVYDVYKEGWRSFAWDNVNSAQRVDELTVTHQSEYNLKLLGTRYVDALKAGVYTGTFREYFEEYKETVTESELISNTGLDTPEANDNLEGWV